MIKDKIISEIIGDNYGNYVVQKALQVSEGFRFMSLIQVSINIIKYYIILNYVSLDIVN